MIRIKISEDQLNEAKKLYNFGALKNSITKGQSNIFGAIGEIIVRDYFLNEKKANVIFESTKDYDMIINGKKVDIKTKKTTVIPKINYNCSVADFNTTQKTDAYIFVRVQEDFSEAYILGYKKKEDFYKEASFNKKGELDVSSNKGWTFAADCYNLIIEKLNPII